MKHRWALLCSILIVFLTTVGLYGLFVEPGQVAVHHLQIGACVFRDRLASKTAIHLSDLHIKEFGGHEQEVLRIVNEENPDFIFLTGDYISWREEPEAALCFLSGLRAKIGTWAVTGDYDYSRPRRSCLFCHDGENGKPSTRHSVRFLKNSYDQLDLPGGHLWIGGIDPGEAGPVAPVEPRPPVRGKGPGILLSHSPMEFEAHGEDEELLIFAGDTHGGQIPLPGLFWQLLGYKKNAYYEQGLFEKGRKKMIVSRGIGTTHIPFRILRPPEIIVVHF